MQNILFLKNVVMVFPDDPLRQQPTKVTIQMASLGKEQGEQESKHEQKGDSTWIGSPCSHGTRDSSSVQPSPLAGMQLEAQKHVGR